MFVVQEIRDLRLTKSKNSSFLFNDRFLGNFGFVMNNKRREKRKLRFFSFGDGKILLIFCVLLLQIASVIVTYHSSLGPNDLSINICICKKHRAFFILLVRKSHCEFTGSFAQKKLCILEINCKKCFIFSDLLRINCVFM